MHFPPSIHMHVSSEQLLPNVFLFMGETIACKERCRTKNDKINENNLIDIQRWRSAETPSNSVNEMSKYQEETPHISKYIFRHRANSQNYRTPRKKETGSKTAHHHSNGTTSYHTPSSCMHAKDNSSSIFTSIYVQNRQEKPY